MRAKFINEAFEKKDKDRARKELLFPRLQEIQDLESCREVLKDEDIPAEAIPQEIKDIVYDQLIEQDSYGDELLIGTSTWRGLSDWDLIKRLFTEEQKEDIILKAANGYDLALEDRDEKNCILILEKQKGRIDRRQLQNGIDYFGWDEFEIIINRSKVKLTANNLIAIGIQTGQVDYIKKGIAKGGKGRAKDSPAMKRVLGEKEYKKYLSKSLNADEIFSRGYNNWDRDLMLRGIKAGAKNVGMQNQEAFTRACDNEDMQLINAIMKDPGFDAEANAKQGAENQRDERHFQIRRAAKEGKTQIVKRLMRNKKVDPSYRNNFALKWAVNGDHDEVIKLLLRDKRVKDNIHQLPKKQFKMLQDKNIIKI
jgi:hypothetical protein